MDGFELAVAEAVAGAALWALGCWVCRKLRAGWRASVAWVEAHERASCRWGRRGPGRWRVRGEAAVVLALFGVWLLAGYGLNVVAGVLMFVLKRAPDARLWPVA